MGKIALRTSTGALLCGLLVSLTLGCTAYRSSRQADIAAQLGNWDEAVLHYMQALEEDPGNIRYRAALLQAQVQASQQHFEKGKKFHEAGVLDRALIEMQQAVQLDPSNQYALVELKKVRAELDAAREARGAPPTIAEMKERTKGARPQPPVLNPRSDEPISLEFPEPTPVQSIYRALGQAFGINVLFDPNLKDVDIPIVLQDVTAQDALEILMRASGHFYKVLDEQTIIIAADTPQNRRNYEDLVIRAFFLSNADVKDAMTTLRSLIGAKQLAMSEQLNAIILRDTADKVRVAEKIIETIDKSKAEVVVDVELLQLSTQRIRDLGMSLSNYSVTQSLDLGGEDVPLRFSDLEFLNQSNWTLTVPNLIYNFIKTHTDAQLLARPKLRISEGEQARLVIGDQIPIPVTSFNSSNTVGGNIVPITSFQYQDVGIQIQIEPRVHHNQEVTLALTVEVSQVSGSVQSGGQAQPIIGTRTIESKIRLKDGETNFLAGLIRTDDADDDTGIPGLSDIPVLGRLFSNNRTESRRTDVILTLTPHIVRLPNITEEDLLPIWVGTESNITFRGGSPRVESEVDGPFDGIDQADPEEIRRRIRERLQRLPRGLREGGDEGEVQQELPPGQDLAPGFGPRDPFGGQQPPPPTSLPGSEEPPPFDPTGGQDPSIFGGDDGGGFGDQASLGGTGSLSSLDLTEAALADGALDGDVDDLVDWLNTGGVALASAADEASGFARYASATSSPLAGAADVVVRALPERRQVARGETFEVVLEAQALAPVAHLPMTLTFDPQILEVAAVTQGSFLGDEGEVELLSDTSNPGRLVLGASRMGPAGGVAGKGPVVKVTFRALRPGAARLGFERSTALGAGLEQRPLVTEPATVTVGEGPVLPERPERPPTRPDGVPEA